MSVIVTANYKGETFEVEIFRDGGIDFPDRDFQYEKAVAEFAPPGSATVQLYEAWTRSPVLIICENLLLPKKCLHKLATDYAEHILPVYGNAPDNYQCHLNAIEAARNFLDGKIDRKALEKARAAAGKLAMTGEVYSPAAASAAWAAEMATTQKPEAIMEAVKWAANEATEAIANSVSPDRFSIEWQQAHDAEVAWQIRRFVDCMEAIGQGKDWPDLGATK